MGRLSYTLTFLMLLLFPYISFSAETVYTWGYGDILGNILEGVTVLFRTADYITLFKIFLTVGIIIVLLSYLGNRNQDPFVLIKFYAFTILVWYLLLAPSVVRTEVYIDDRQNPSYNRVITDVPYVVAKLLSWFSRFEKFTAEKMETVFAVPDDLKYANTGFLTAFGVMANANSHKIVDPYLYLSVSNYMEDCVFPDILDGSKDIEALARSNNLWADVGYTNPARTTRYYDDSNPSGIILTCDGAYANITGKLNTYINTTGFEKLSGIIGGFSSATINTMLGTASEYYMNFSVTGQAYLQQAIAMNMFSEAFINFAKVNGLSGEGVAFGAAKAEETARYNMVLSGVLGAKYIPVIKGILTTLIVGLIPILTLLLVTPLFKRVLFGFLMILGWLSLWHIGEVLINAIINVKASSYISTLADGNYNLLIRGAVDSTVLDYINTVSSFYWAIPTIAFLIASGFSIYAMNSLSGQMAGKMQGATGRIASELSTGSINTASSVSTGRRWSFGSFSQMGNTASYGMTWNDRFGRTSDVHLQDTGWLGSGNFGLDNGSVQTFSEQMKSLTGMGGPNLGSGRITGMIGRKDGNSYELHAGYMGDLAITKGTNFVVDDKGNITGVIHGFDRQTGREWTLEFSGGKLVSAKSKAGGSGEAISYRQGQDGVAYATLETANVTQGVMFNKDGDTVTSLSMPDKVSGKDHYEKAINENIKDRLAFTDSRRIADIFKHGTQEQKRKALDYLFSLASDEKWGSKEGQKYVQDVAGKALETTLANLSKGNENAVSKADKISKERALQYTAGGSGYIEVSGGGKVPFIEVFAAKAGVRAEAGFKNTWLSKDGIIVETKDGSFYKLDFSDSAKTEFAKNFAESLFTDRTHSAGYSEDKRASVSDSEATNRIREGLFQDMAEKAKQDVMELEALKSLSAKEGVSSDKDLTRHIIDTIHDKTGKSYAEVLNEINKDPSKLDEYLKDEDILREVARRAYGDESKLDTVREAGRVKEKEEGLDFSKRVAEAVASNNTQEISQLKTEALQLYENGQINKQQFDSIMGQLEASKGYDTPVQKVDGKDYDEDDARELAQEKNINKDNASKAFNTAVAGQTHNAIQDIKDRTGLTNKIENGRKYLQDKYGRDVGQGLEREMIRLNNEIKRFNDTHGYNYSMEDIASGKALNDIENRTSYRIKELEKGIQSVKGMMNNPNVWNTLDENTKENIHKKYEELIVEKKELEKHLNEVKGLQKRAQELSNDSRLYRDITHYENALPKVNHGVTATDNGFFTANPDVKLNVPTLQYTQGPEYTFPNKQSDFNAKANYWGGKTGLSNEKLGETIRKYWQNASPYRK